MGKRVQVKLADLIANLDVSVRIYTRRIEDDPNYDPIVYREADVSHQGRGTILDVNVYGDEIVLEADFNSWGSGWKEKYEFFENLGCVFKVV